MLRRANSINDSEHLACSGHCCIDTCTKNPLFTSRMSEYLNVLCSLVEIENKIWYFVSYVTRKASFIISFYIFCYSWPCKKHIISHALYCLCHAFYTAVQCGLSSQHTTTAVCTRTRLYACLPACAPACKQWSAVLAACAHGQLSLPQCHQHNGPSLCSAYLHTDEKSYTWPQSYLRSTPSSPPPTTGHFPRLDTPPQGKKTLSIQSACS